MARRTTLRSSKGKKLYAVRKADGSFADIQTYASAHAADLRLTSKAEKPVRAKAAKKRTAVKKAAVKKAAVKKAAVKKGAVKKGAVKKAARKTVKKAGTKAVKKIGARKKVRRG